MMMSGMIQRKSAKWEREGGGEREGEGGRERERAML